MNSTNAENILETYTNTTNINALSSEIERMDIIVAYLKDIRSEYGTVYEIQKRYAAEDDAFNDPELIKTELFLNVFDSIVAKAIARTALLKDKLETVKNINKSIESVSEIDKKLEELSKNKVIEEYEDHMGD